MQPFPYRELLKQSARTTVSHWWLWAFGLFTGGITGLNTFLDDYLISLFPDGQTLAAFVSQDLSTLWPVLLLAVGLFLFFLIFPPLARAAIIWTAGQLAQTEKDPSVGYPKPDFRKALQAGTRYLWRVLMIELLAFLVIVLVTLIFLIPVVYLNSVGAGLRALLLVLLGLFVFLPGVVGFGFVYILGPVLAVLYDRNVKEAVVMALDLFRKRFKECLLLAVILLMLSVLLLLLVDFSMILFGFALSPVSVLFAAIFLTALFSLLVRSWFSVFYEIAWVLAVDHMVGALKKDDEEEVYVAEPVS